MALTPPVIYSSLAAARTAGTFPFGGAAFDQFALGLATGVSTWAISQPYNLALIGASSGTAGAGVIQPLTTRLIVPANVAVVYAACLAAGLNGPLGQALASVVASGLSAAFTTAGQYVGSSAGVGVGVDVSKVVVANPATLTAALMSGLSSYMGGGGAMPMMATGLANGIVALLLGGTGTGIVTGTPSIAPAVGVTNSVVV